jgi:hypothetical protein
MKRIALIGVAVAAIFSLASCSNDELPTRSEFVDQLTSESGGAIDEETAGCIYDKVKAKEELVKAMFNEDSAAGSEFADEIGNITGACLGVG